jgi:hypothetical protein
MQLVTRMRRVFKETVWIAAVVSLLATYHISWQADEYGISRWLVLGYYAKMATIISAVAYLGWLTTERLFPATLALRMLFGATSLAFVLWLYQYWWMATYSYGQSSAPFPRVAAFFFADAQNISFVLVTLPLIVFCDCIWIWIRKKAVLPSFAQ